MTKGWFIGEFKPSIYPTENVEVAVKKYKKGEKEDIHHHRKATEITVVVSGAVKMNNLVFKQDEIITIDPYEATDFLALEDTVTVVVKIPGSLNDKYDGVYCD